MAVNNKNLNQPTTIGEVNGNGAAFIEAKNRLKEKNIKEVSGMLDDIFLDEEFKKYLKKAENRKRIEEYKNKMLEAVTEIQDGFDKITVVDFAIESLSEKSNKPSGVIKTLEKIKERLISEEEEGEKNEPPGEEKKTAPADDGAGAAVKKKGTVASRKPDILEEKDKQTAGIKMEEEKKKRKDDFEKKYKGNTYERKDGNITTRITVLNLIPGIRERDDKVEVLELERGRKARRKTGKSDFLIAIEKRGFARVEARTEKEKQEAKEKFEKKYGTNVSYRKGKLSFTLVGFIPGNGIDSIDWVEIKNDLGKSIKYSLGEFKDIVEKQGFKREAGIDERKEEALASFDNAKEKFADLLEETAKQNEDPDMKSFKKEIRNFILESQEKLEQDKISAKELKEIKLKLDAFLKMDLAEEFDNFKKKKADKSGAGKPAEGEAKAEGAEDGELSEAQKKRKDSFTKRYGENINYILDKKDYHEYSETSFLLVGMIPGETRSKDRIKIVAEDGEEKLITSKEFLEMRKEGYKKEEPAGEDDKKEDSGSAGEIIEDSIEASIEASKDDEESDSGDSGDAEPAEEGGDLDVEVDVEVGFSEKEKKIMEGSEKIAAAFIEKQKKDFDFDNFPKKRLKVFLETQAVKFLMDKFKSHNIFRGKEEDVAEVIVEKIKDKF